MSRYLIARRYAKVLLDLGEKAGSAPAVGQELDRIAALVTGNADLSRLAVSPMQTPKKKAIVFDAVLASADATDLLRRFFKVVAEAGRLDCTAAIRLAFHELADERAGIVEAKVASAQPLSDAQAQALSQALAKRTGKIVRLAFRQDPTLIGGLKVQVGSTVLDASLRGKLAQIKQQLLTA
ncbi:MAG TPA: ATP synthase F1 subunit delta [Holophagaceae bacterium]|nr:ATP synthase F1 subunit delta [Holophagaceae bacterium]